MVAGTQLRRLGCDRRFPFGHHLELAVQGSAGRNGHSEDSEEEEYAAKRHYQQFRSVRHANHRIAGFGYQPGGRGPRKTEIGQQDAQRRDDGQPKAARTPSRYEPASTMMAMKNGMVAASGNSKKDATVSPTCCRRD